MTQPTFKEGKDQNGKVVVDLTEPKTPGVSQNLSYLLDPSVLVSSTPLDIVGSTPIDQLYVDVE